MAFGGGLQRAVEKKKESYVNSTTPEQRAADAEKARRNAGVDPRIVAEEERAKSRRESDRKEGEAFALPLFGDGNARMAEIMEQQKARALGLNGAEVGVMRDRGLQGINQQLATNLRQLKGLQGATGLMGGASLGQALPSLSKATQARAGLETDIALADMQRRGEELDRYERTVTGERNGLVGTQIGFMGLGAADASNARQFVLGQDFINGLRGAGGGKGAMPYDTHNPLSYDPVKDAPLVATYQANTGNTAGAESQRRNSAYKPWDPRGWNTPMSTSGGGGVSINPSSWGR
jgi:hypothetical protein